MKCNIHVVSLGPGDPDLLNTKTLFLLREAESLILRTARHPLVPWLLNKGISFTALDSLYDQFDTFDALNRAAAKIVLRSSLTSSVVYAVPDASTDLTVRTLLNHAPGSMTVSVVPGVSLYDSFLASALPFIPDRPLITVNAREIITGFSYDLTCSLLITELDNAIQASEVKLLLSEILDDEYTILFLSLDASPIRIPLYKLDRLADFDHRCAVLVPSSFFRDGKTSENTAKP